MPAEIMRPELHMVYKNVVDNVAAMKKQQCIITNYVVAVFAGIAALFQLTESLCLPAPCGG
jgi:hypothetical protein